MTALSQPLVLVPACNRQLGDHPFHIAGQKIHQMHQPDLIAGHTNRRNFIGNLQSRRVIPFLQCQINLPQFTSLGVAGQFFRPVLQKRLTGRQVATLVAHTE